MLIFTGQESKVDAGICIDFVKTEQIKPNHICFRKETLFSVVWRMLNCYISLRVYFKQELIIYLVLAPTQVYVYSSYAQFIICCFFSIRL